MSTTDLQKYTKGGYNPGRSFITRALWYVVCHTFYSTPWVPFYGIKRVLLKLFGAEIGKNVVIKPRVLIKYPWLLSIGDYSWIGEGCWIDNLAQVTIGKNCCISQGVLIETGSHNYKNTDFKLITSQVVLEDGVWLCTKSIVTAGTVCQSHSVLAAGSVAPIKMLPYSIYKGNPAIKIKEREIND